jgi:predicted ABC-type ATPase
MFIIAGPPGAGKSSVFSINRFAERVFNADDRAAELNSGSYQGIPLSVRATVNREFEEFVHANIRTGTPFALETTLRSSITFDQAKLATENGFRVVMRYVALATPELHIERVMQRASRGGHAASEATLRRIHTASLNNLPVALVPEQSGIEFVRVYDNSGFGQSPALVLEVRSRTRPNCPFAGGFPGLAPVSSGVDFRPIAERASPAKPSSAYVNLQSA